MTQQMFINNVFTASANALLRFQFVMRQKSSCILVFIFLYIVVDCVLFLYVTVPTKITFTCLCTHIEQVKRLLTNLNKLSLQRKMRNVGEKFAKSPFV